MSAPTWHLVTGEYPPRCGGVGDYTRVLARGLADAGREVHVWAPVEADAEEPGGVRVHRVEGFGRAGLGRLDAALDAHRELRTLLVQYAPRAFGMHGMNLRFCNRLLNRRLAGEDVRVMFHEPYLPFSLRHPLHALPAFVNRLMAAALLKASRRWYVSTPAWETLLRPFAPPGTGPGEWLPIPSTVAVQGGTTAVKDARRRLSNRGSHLVVAHFGTYGRLVAPLLMPVVLEVLRAEPRATFDLFGENAGDFWDEGMRGHPELFSRVTPLGRLEPRDLSLYLQAADVMVQPYPDGATGRRTTLMAALAHGAPTVTTRGQFTEDVWSSAPVPMTPAGDAAAMAREVLALLRADPKRRAQVGAAGRDFYERHFSLQRTLDVLLRDEALTRPP